MNLPMRRATLATVALLTAALGAGSLFLSVDDTSSAPNEYIIEVNESGLNPPSCTINKGTRWAWKNVGNSVHRIIKPDAGVAQPPIFDTGDLQPGETSKQFALPVRDSWSITTSTTRS